MFGNHKKAIFSLNSLEKTPNTKSHLVANMLPFTGGIQEAARSQFSCLEQGVK